MAHFTKLDKETFILRLNRISGQIHGICRMIDNGRECRDVLRQIMSVQRSLTGVWKQFAKHYMEDSVKNLLPRNKNCDEVIETLVEGFSNLK